MRVRNTVEREIGRRAWLEGLDADRAWSAIETKLARAVADGPGRSAWLSEAELGAIIDQAKAAGRRPTTQLQQTLANALATGTLLGRPLRMGSAALRSAAAFIGRPELADAVRLIAELEEALEPGADGYSRLTRSAAQSIVEHAGTQPPKTVELLQSTLADALQRGELFGLPFGAGAGAITVLLRFTKSDPANLHSRFRISAGDFHIAKRRTGLAPKTGALVQLRQAARCGRLGMIALLQRTRGTQMSPIVARSILSALNVAPVRHPDTAARAHYQSKLSGVSADDAYRYFVDNLADVFGAAGLNVIVAGGAICDGVRLLIDEPGPPPVLLPIELRLDPDARRVRLLCLDGHAFAGENSFSFVPSVDGQTTYVEQVSEFEGTSPMVWLGQAMGAMTRQTDAWRAVHELLHEVLAPEADR